MSSTWTALRAAAYAQPRPVAFDFDLFGTRRTRKRIPGASYVDLAESGTRADSGRTRIVVFIQARPRSVLGWTAATANDCGPKSIPRGIAITRVTGPTFMGYDTREGAGVSRRGRTIPAETIRLGSRDTQERVYQMSCNLAWSRLRRNFGVEGRFTLAIDFASPASHIIRRSSHRSRFEKKKFGVVSVGGKNRRA